MTIRLFMPYTSKFVIPNRPLVISPLRPNKNIIESESTNGGDIMGRVAIVLKNGFHLMFVLVIAYAYI